MRRFVEASARLPTGDPGAEGTGLAPMARADLRDELHKQVQASVAKGARVLAGGEPVAGSYAGYPATVLDQVGPGMPAYDEELFGPVAAVIRVKDEAEAKLSWPESNMAIALSCKTSEYIFRSVKGESSRP